MIAGLYFGLAHPIVSLRHGKQDGAHGYLYVRTLVDVESCIVCARGHEFTIARLFADENCVRARVTWSYGERLDLDCDGGLRGDIAVVSEKGRPTTLAELRADVARFNREAAIRELTSLKEREFHVQIEPIELTDTARLRQPGSTESYPWKEVPPELANHTLGEFECQLGPDLPWRRCRGGWRHDVSQPTTIWLEKP